MKPLNSFISHSRLDPCISDNPRDFPLRTGRYPRYLDEIVSYDGGWPTLEDLIEREVVAVVEIDGVKWAALLDGRGKGWRVYDG